MPKYIGTTIGPIYKTISNARKTGELWGASYLFSYIMKRLIKEFKDNREFILPYTKDSSVFQEPMEIGLFHDRFIFESNEGDFEKLENVKDEILNEISLDMERLIKVDRDIINDYIDNYFQIYSCEINIEDTSKGKIIKEISKVLDTLELKTKYINKEQRNYIAEYIENENIKQSMLSKDAFGKYVNSYESIVKIALRDYEEKLKNVDFNNEDINIYDELIGKLSPIERNQFKKAYKYIAIVHADGDSMGRVINNLDSINDYQQFSKKLFQFVQNANEEIKDFKGYPIFAGGDDLLFFAPIIRIKKDNKNNTTIQNIFYLIDKISEKFNEQFASYTNINPKPTLSFGISIVYYKFPLYEALEESKNQLFSVAKNENNKVKINDKEKTKNSIAIKVIKHSGQYFDAFLNKESKTYKVLKQIIEFSDDNDILSSIENKLYQDKFIFKQLLKTGSDINKRLENYFINNFNEAEHKEANIQKYLEKIQELILTVNEEYVKDEDEKIDTIYSLIRFIKFLNEKGEKDE